MNKIRLLRDYICEACVVVSPFHLLKSTFLTFNRKLWVTFIQSSIGCTQLENDFCHIIYPVTQWDGALYFLITHPYGQGYYFKIHIQ